MKGFLLIILFACFAQLQCQKSDHFFVTGRGNKKAICIRPYTSVRYYPFPTFDLDKLQIPLDVGLKYWDWLGDWQLQNDTNVRNSCGKNQVLIAGNQPFHFVARVYPGALVSILASNLTLWMAHKDRPRGRGLLFEVDHLNETTKLKDTTLKFCTRNPEKKKANCTILDYKNGTNFLNGTHWTEFLIDVNINGVEMYETSYGIRKPVVQCTWKNTNISHPLITTDDFDLFAKSHQRNAAFYTYDDLGFTVDLSSNKEMKRKYTKRRSGKFCVEVDWNKNKSFDSNELFEAKNLASGRVQPATNTTHDNRRAYYQWNHLDAGEYEFTVRFDKRQPKYIDLCIDRDSNIERTWTSIPKAITKCQFNVGLFHEFSAGPSSPLDPTIDPKWTFEQWEHVCDQLGIDSNDSRRRSRRELIKFCNWKGCNLSMCPSSPIPSQQFIYALFLNITRAVK